MTHLQVSVCPGNENNATKQWLHSSLYVQSKTAAKLPRAKHAYR